MKSPPDPSYDPDYADECCMSCGARQERGDGSSCNRCNGDYDEGREKSAIARLFNKSTAPLQGSNMLTITQLAKRAAHQKQAELPPGIGDALGGISKDVQTNAATSLGALAGSVPGGLMGAGGAAGATIGGLKGLFGDPGEDEEGNKKSRLMAILKGGLGGGALGAAGGLAAGVGGLAGSVGGGAAGGAAGRGVAKLMQ